MTLLCYRIEWMKYASAWKRRSPNQKEATKIINKLRRHFKVRDACCGKDNVSFTTNSRGIASLSTSSIRLPKTQASLGLMIHEVAHLVANQRYRSKGHDRAFKRGLKIVHNYAIRKHFFDGEVKWQFDREKQIPGWTFYNEDFQRMFSEMTK